MSIKTGDKVTVSQKYLDWYQADTGHLPVIKIDTAYVVVGVYANAKVPFAELRHGIWRAPVPLEYLIFIPSEDDE